LRIVSLLLPGVAYARYLAIQHSHGIVSDCAVLQQNLNATFASAGKELLFTSIDMLTSAAQLIFQP